MVLGAVLLLAGCADEPALFPPTDYESHGIPVADAPGVVLIARVTGGGDLLRIHAEATNQGTETFLVPNACTGNPSAAANATAPFSIAARRASGTSGDFPVYPARGCAEVTTTTFSPGERLEFEVDWDGTFWSKALERQTVVFSGPHDIEVELELYVGPDATPTPMVAQVPIEVLDA